MSSRGFRKILVTGGAGFIGSHLVDVLVLRGNDVRVLDNLNTGKLENIEQHLGKPNFSFLHHDLLSKENLIKAVKDSDVIFHLAAVPEVRGSSLNAKLHLNQNFVATHDLLETIRHSGVKLFVFTSSSTVYGEASKIPTPEEYGPMKPISIYGASKLASEALVTAYAYTYGFRAIIYRLANIVGPRMRHGVIYDFILKLKSNTSKLEVLGDGTQTKSYLYVMDCVGGMLQGIEKATNQVEIINVGSEDWINVKRVAETVVEEMHLRHVKLKFTGGVDGGRGWKGDVKRMKLDISKLCSLGWRPKYTSLEAVKLTTRALLTELAET